jgi:FemAB-related protein (PEP-CTERM system-associated)
VVVSLVEHPNHAWDEFVLSQPDSVFFHRLGWKQVIQQAYGYRAHYLMAQRGGRPSGVLPLFLFAGRLGSRCLISVPQADYAGILSADRETTSALASGAVDLAQKLRAQYVELRTLGLGLHGLPTNDTRVSPMLALPSSEKRLWDSFAPKVRAQIRKAAKSGIVVKRDDGGRIAEFQRVFDHNMRRLGSPTQPREFFPSIFRAFPADAVLLLAENRNEVIGGLVALIHRETIEIPWASSLAEYFPLCPNNALYWEAMKYGISRGCNRLNFGSSPVGSGTYRFKMQWGAEAVPLRFQYIKNTSLPSMQDRRARLSYRAFSTIWKRLPLAVTNRLGPVIMRHLPL